jgi:hypothetical protein
VGAADCGHAVDIALIERAAGKIDPMILLALLGMADMVLIGEETGDSRGLGDLGVEFIEGAADQL